MAHYGLPYQGSKQSLCDELIRIFPATDHFYDLFGGGGSVTHAMVLRRSKDFKQFHYNEIKSEIIECFKNAVAGKYSYDVFKPKWISREEFFEKKYLDGYIKLCWSFSCNGKDYLFSKDIEAYKKSMHMAIVFNEFDDVAKKIFKMNAFKESSSIKDRRLLLRHVQLLGGKSNQLKSIESLESLEQAQSLGQLERMHHLENVEQAQRLEQLRQTEQLERLEQAQGLHQLKKLQQFERLERVQGLEGLPQKIVYSSKSYEKAEILPNSIIYCDIPYEDTKGYALRFNRPAFLDWADKHDTPIFISEYDIRDPRFRLIWTKKKTALMSGQGSGTKVLEKVYCNAAALRFSRK